VSVEAVPELRNNAAHVEVVLTMQVEPLEMVTVSPAAGTPAGDQLEAVLQVPEAAVKVFCPAGISVVKKTVASKITAENSLFFIRSPEYK
jgi:hypothetical protein